MSKTAKITLNNIKSSDGWHELAHQLLFDKFKNKHLHLDDDEISNKFYTEVVSKLFQYGEIANLEIEFDDQLNIIGGKILVY